jgi:hypothetical protein
MTAAAVAAATTAGSTAEVVSPLHSRLVFPTRLVAGIAYVALTVARLIALEVVERLGATSRRWAVIAVSRIVTVIDVAIEAMRSMEPRSCTKE